MSLSFSLSPCPTLSVFSTLFSPPPPQVMVTCQKAGGVASGGPSLLPFSCSTNDVLGCIMHVLSQGYLRRHDDSPHIVEYVAEGPATPKKGRAQFSFARGQLGAEGGGASGHHGNPLRCEPTL